MPHVQPPGGASRPSLPHWHSPLHPIASCPVATVTSDSPPHRSPAAAILRSLAAAGPERDEAARDLLALLDRLAQTSLLARNMQRFRIPPHERQDVVSSVMMKVLDASQDGPMSVADSTDAASVAYLSTMLAHCWIQEHRARKTDRTVQPEDISALRAPDRDETRSDELNRRSIEAALELLEKVVGAMLEARPERYREGTLRAWSQLRDVVFDGADFKTRVLRDADLTCDDPPDEIQRAVDTAFQAHKRLRGYLVDTANDLHARGEVNAEQHALVNDLVSKVLLRCQRRPAKGISPGDPPQIPPRKKGRP